MKIKAFFKNKIVKIILAVIAVPVLGFVLLNLTFLFDFLIQSLIDLIIKPFTAADINMDWQWFPPVKHALFIVIIGLISWPILKSKLNTILKAIYLTVPLAVVLVTIGISLYRWPLAVYSLGGLLLVGILCYFYRTKLPWIYYYTVILIALALAILGLLGVDI